MKVKILITGSSGYIGQSLVKTILEATNWSLILLQSKKSEINFKEKRVKYCFYDEEHFNISACLRVNKPDVVINLAGYFVAEHKKEDLDLLIESNLVFGARLLDAMKESGIKRIVNTGSYWETYKQDGIYNPANLYAAFKKCFVDVAKFYVEANNFQVITLRLYDVYGPKDERNKIIPLLFNAALNKQKLDMSPGEQLIDLVYIDDVVGAYIKAVNYLMKKNKKCNISVDIGSAKPFKLKKIVNLMEEIIADKIKINFGGRNYRAREIMVPRADIEYTKKILSWKPRVFLNKGLKEILEK